MLGESLSVMKNTIRLNTVNHCLGNTIFQKLKQISISWTLKTMVGRNGKMGNKIYFTLFNIFIHCKAENKALPHLKLLNSASQLRLKSNSFK